LHFIPAFDFQILLIILIVNLINFVVIIGIEFQRIPICCVLEPWLLHPIVLLWILGLLIELVVVVEVAAHVQRCRLFVFDYLFQGVQVLFVGVRDVVQLLFIRLDFVEVFHYFGEVETVLVGNFGLLFGNHFHRRYV
jgi:hypothetical protein